MNAQIIIEENHEKASARAAELVADQLRHTPGMTVTFAAGDTPCACYQLLLDMQQAGTLRLDAARYMGLDEWVGLGAEEEGSCLSTMNHCFYLPAGIPEERISCFDGLTADPEGEAQRMNQLLADSPIQLAVLGVGVNGHVGFNEPGLSLDGEYSLLPLSESTQQVGKKYFGGRDTPKMGATTTLHALQRASTVVILATGEKKRAAVAEILSGNCALPVGAFLDHPGAVYIFDNAAAGTR